MRESFSKFANKWNKKSRTKDGLLGNSKSVAKRVTLSVIEKDLLSSVWKEGFGSANKARSETQSEKYVVD